MQDVSVLGFITNIALAIAIVVVGFWLSKKLRELITEQMVKYGVDEMLAGFLANITRILVLAFVIIAALNQVGIETTSLVAILGAAGLAVGLALQGSLSNFAAGVMIVAFRPFDKGDYIEAGGIAGSVEEIKIFSTKLKTPDNKIIIVPNSNIMDGSITNYSAMDTRRIDLVFGIGYDDDLLYAKQILTDIVAGDSRILNDPAPVIAVSELADSSVNFVVRPWVNAADYWDVLFYLTETVKLRFDQENISIPYPQQDVHIHQPAQPSPVSNVQNY